MRDQPFAVYILANRNDTVLYVGMTNDILRRVSEHREKLVPGFTKRYNVDKLVHYEFFESAEHAIAREKQLKAGSRKRKEELVCAANPEWRDLYDRIKL